MISTGHKDSRFDSKTRDELKSLMPTSTIVLPLGSTEQHGHHLPTRVDVAIVEAVADRAVILASKQVPILLAPVLPFGFAHHHLAFSGTISIRSETYISVLVDLVTSLSDQGARRIVLFNGHGGNQAAMHAAIDRAVYEYHLPLDIAACSYWSVVTDLAETAGLDPALVPGHAGHLETSLMLVLDPSLVDVGRCPQDGPSNPPLGRPDLAGARLRRSGLWQRSDGRSDDAHLASQVLGQRLLELIVERVAAFFVAFHKSVQL
jgi:creatinine amidohydrolase